MCLASAPNTYGHVDIISACLYFMFYMYFYVLPFGVSLINDEIDDDDDGNGDDDDDWYRDKRHRLWW